MMIKAGAWTRLTKGQKMILLMTYAKADKIPDKEGQTMIDINLLHKLFMDGEKISVISNRFKVSEGHIRRIICKERKFNPEIWPTQERTGVNKHAKRIHFYTTRLAKMFKVHPARRDAAWARRMNRLWAYKQRMDSQLPDPQDLLK
ncbi:hypothetical protein [Heyndrickxia acidiproducens]|uniref:hypothetical protein n=1 Tax=Heyndrickxia acidiproducens TaxID=1121084 RepID=UPI0003824EEC|nr:hypothetical protein [Heyndrickxia acidiproducens]